MSNLEQDSVATQVRTQLRALVLPLREQLAEIEKRLVKLNRERADLLEAKLQITRTITRLEPAQAQANGAGALAAVNFAKKREAVEQFIETHELAEGFTAAELNRWMKEENFGPTMSASKTLQAVRELHEQGLLRADRIVKGGAQLYVPVGKK